MKQKNPQLKPSPQTLPNPNNHPNNPFPQTLSNPPEPIVHTIKLQITLP